MRRFGELSVAQRFLLRLTGHFLARRCKWALSITDVIPGQLERLTQGHSPAIVAFRPIYDRALFKDVPPPDWSKSPFRVMFVGRVAEDKGVLTLLDAARHLRQMGHKSVAFDVCGVGSELDKLKSAVAQEDLTDFALHGHCDRDRLRKLYSTSHAIIVPTTRNFPEGFNRVSIEAILCGRPAIVSSAALEPKIASATIEVKPADAKAIANAIVSLQTDRSLYDRLQVNAVVVQGCFYDKHGGWENGLRSILANQGFYPQACNQTDVERRGFAESPGTSAEDRRSAGV